MAIEWFYQDQDEVRVKELSQRTGLCCEDETRTVQSQAEEADINTIVRRFGLTGHMPEGVRPPMYGDFDTIGDYREAIEAVKAAERSFMAMPADVRYRFDNDPGSFVDFCSDPRNIDEMRKLGLAVPKAVEPQVGDPVSS